MSHFHKSLQTLQLNQTKLCIRSFCKIFLDLRILATKKKVLFALRILRWTSLSWSLIEVVFLKNYLFLGKIDLLRSLLGVIRRIIKYFLFWLTCKSIFSTESASLWTHCYHQHMLGTCASFIYIKYIFILIYKYTFLVVGLRHE